MPIRKKHRWLLFSVLVAVVLIAFLHSSEPEPTYGGRTFTSWFHEAEMMSYDQVNAPSTLAMRQMGAAAVPLLASRVRQEDSSLFRAWWAIYPKLSARIRARFSPPRRPGARQETAAKLLFEIGPGQCQALPDLIAAYDRAYAECYRLSFWSPINWTAQLANPPPAVLVNTPNRYSQDGLRLWVLMTLCRCAENQDNLALLLAALHEPHFNGAILYQLDNNTNLLPAIKLSGPLLLTALGDASPSVRGTAAAMLGNLTDQPGVVPALLKAAQDPSPSVRQNAAQSLLKAPLDLENALPTLARLFHDTDDQVRSLSIRLLFKSAGGGAKLFSALIAALGSANPQVRLGAADALAIFGSRSKQAIPKLTELSDASHEPDAQVRAAAAAALAKIAPQKSPP